MPPRQTMPRTVRPIARTLALVAAVGGALLLLFGPGGGTAMASHKHTYKLKPGLSLTTISTSKGPYKIRVLTINNPAKNAPTLDAGTAGNTFPNVRRTSDIASAYGAVAAVNGDFGRDGRPLHASAEDGDLRTSGLTAGVAFAMSADERRGFAKRPSVRVKAVTNNPLAGNFSVDVWNAGSSGSGRIAAFTPVGGSNEKPDSDNCSVKLLPAPGSAGDRSWGPNGEVARTYVVDRQPDPCPNSAPAVGNEPGTVTLVAKRSTPRGDTIKALQPGDQVTLSWNAGLKNQLDVTGGAPQLLADPDGNGRPSIKAPRHCGSYFCDRNPRTGVGFNHACVVGRDTCRVFIVVVDGRRPGWSIGMNLVQFAKVFKNLGADWAVNFDGGGGATMWVSQHGKYCESRASGGCLVNRPSDAAGQRPVTTSLMVLPGKDPGETLAARRRSAVPAALTQPASAADLAQADLSLTDPGSTGGLIDAMFAGGLGRVPPMTPDLQQALQTYRSRK